MKSWPSSVRGRRVLLARSDAAWWCQVTNADGVTHTPLMGSKDRRSKHDRHPLLPDLPDLRRPLCIADPMSRPNKTISAKEAVDIGLIQELNRLFLNPRGFALEVVTDARQPQGQNVLGIGHIQDFRDDPASIAFIDPGKPCPKKARQVAALHDYAKAIRDADLGTLDGIQPCADDPASRDG